MAGANRAGHVFIAPETAIQISMAETSLKNIDHTPLFSAYDRAQSKRLNRASEARMQRNSLQKFMLKTEEAKTSDGFLRIDKCREALCCIDRQGYTRSFHQRLFHDHFIRACARIFWKTEPAGSFARCHQKILEHNGWDHLSQEILVSTPRRWVSCLILKKNCLILKKNCSILKVFCSILKVSCLILKGVVTLGEMSPRLLRCRSCRFCA